MAKRIITYDTNGNAFKGIITCKVCGRVYEMPQEGWWNWFHCSEHCCAITREEIANSEHERQQHEWE